jgi:ribosomal protein L25 (general stress protein Ctc)
MVRQQSPKSTILTNNKTKKATDDGHTDKKQTHWYAKISKFKKFKISILTRTYTHNPTNQRCKHRDEKKVASDVDIFGDTTHE